MKHSTPPLRQCKRCTVHAHRQQGIILIITLIMLTIISSVAALTIKGSSSTEALANNTRTQGLAMQAAEAALRYCEAGAIRQHLIVNALQPDASITSLHTLTIAIAPAAAALPQIWQTLGSWQGVNAVSNPIGASDLIGLTTLDNFGGAAGAIGNGMPGSFATVYKRQPDCIIQYAANSNNQVITVVARGFGPEVSTPQAVGEIPNGSEVFLQSIRRP
jgi:Tfp pilus assembly protein PilX